MKLFDLKSFKIPNNLPHWTAIIFSSLMIVAFFTLDVSEGRFSIFDTLSANRVWLNTTAFVGICWILKKTKKAVIEAQCGKTQTVFQFMLSAFFSFFSVLSIYFDSGRGNGLSVALSSFLALISVAAAFFGGVILFFIIIRLIWSLSSCSNRLAKRNARVFSDFFGKNLYRNCILAMTLCWLPQYIIRFPGVMPYDAWQSMAMYYGCTETTTQHPLLWNILLGKLTDFGMSIGINWMASFVICLIQHIVAMFAVSYTITTIKKLGFGNCFLVGILAFYVILPPMSLYASTVYNDYIFSLAIMLLTVEFVYYLYDRKRFFSQKHHWILTAIASFCTIIRYNGLYTMLAVIFVIALREFLLLIKNKWKGVIHTLIILALLIIPLLTGQIIQSSLNDAYNATEIRSRAMVAMPIQQTVRCLIDHGDDIPKEDYEAIHTVLTWTDEEYAETYNPRNFDTVKESFKTDATNEEMSDFIKAWIHLVCRYPKTCFMATANQTYYLFSPLVQNVRYYESTVYHSNASLEDYGFDPEPFIFKSSLLESLCRKLFDFQCNIFVEIPIIGITVNEAAYTILLFSICLCLLFRKDRRPLILTVSMLVVLGITFLGPAVYRHPRYVFPIMFSIPLLIAVFMFKENGNMSLTTEENV